MKHFVLLRFISRKNTSRTRYYARRLTMARNFTTVYRNIMAIAPKELADALEKHVVFWAPEIVWYKLSEYVNKYGTPSSTDSQSIAIYAELCDLSSEDMKSMF